MPLPVGWPHPLFASVTWTCLPDEWKRWACKIPIRYSIRPRDNGASWSRLFGMPARESSRQRPTIHSERVTIWLVQLRSFSNCRGKRLPQWFLIGSALVLHKVTLMQTTVSSVEKQWTMAPLVSWKNFIRSLQRYVTRPFKNKPQSTPKNTNTMYSGRVQGNILAF